MPHGLKQRQAQFHVVSVKSFLRKRSIRKQNKMAAREKSTHFWNACTILFFLVLMCLITSEMISKIKYKTTCIVDLFEILD